MNSRSNVNDTNLGNFSAELNPLNQIESKDGILTFPFDHIYACHTESSENRPELQLDKEVEISTHCVVADEAFVETTSPAEFIHLSEKLTAAESQNKRLKDLLIYHLDLIQQQNELITKKEKSCLILKQENDTLRNRLTCMERRQTVTPARHGLNFPRHGLNPPRHGLLNPPRYGLNPPQHGLNPPRHGLNPPPLVHVSSSTIGQSSTKAEADASKVLLNSYTELLIPDNRTNTYIFDSDLNKPEKLKIKKIPETQTSGYVPCELNVLSILDTKNINCQEYTMIENKPSFIKKEPKSENRQDAMYTMTTGNSATPVIQKIQRSRRKTSGSIISINRAPKTPTVVKTDPVENYNFYADDKTFNRNFTVNKKSKMINTYSKSSRNNIKKTTLFTGSLSDRLQLIDTTPTGEDPYQLGEADMREQSPIPKLTLKTNLGKMKISSKDSNSTITSKRFYSTLSEEPEKRIQKIKLNRYNLTNTYVHPSEIKKEDDSDPGEDLDFVKSENDIDWETYSNKAGNETSLCDFSYGENANKLAPKIMDSVKYQLYSSEPEKKPLSVSNVKNKEKTMRRPERTTSLMVPNRTFQKEGTKGDAPSRKRSLSTTGLLKTIKKENAPKFPPFMIKPKPIKAKAPAPVPRKKSPVPGVETRVPYHTLMGDPDISWYLGLDPDIKFENVDQAAETKAETVEVPRWREKVYTSIPALEGIEILDDKVFEKRHQKLEAEERRQLRWHMRRVREQRHVERLRQRQRDTWYSAAPAPQPTNYTVWPQPLRDVKFIEITDTMPVNAFGVELPAMPKKGFILPWIRSSKALKRAKRIKTLPPTTGEPTATTCTTATATAPVTSTVSVPVPATNTVTSPATATVTSVATTELTTTLHKHRMVI